LIAATKRVPLIRLLFIVHLLFASMCIQGQNTVTLFGSVADAETGEMLSYVTITVKSKMLGSSTDSTGRFRFKLNFERGDSLQFSYVGYYNQVIVISEKSSQEFIIKLKPSVSAIQEVLISSDPDPGKTFMKKVLARNKENDPSRFKKINAKRWLRSEVAAFDPKLALDATGKLALKDKGVFGSRTRAFQRNKIESDTIQGEIPWYYSEKLSSYSLANRPYGESEEIIAIKSTRLLTDKILEPLARWDVGLLNLYDPLVLLFGKAFASPFAPNALTYYDFFIIDSVTVGPSYHHIRLQAIPKQWRGNVFSGFVTVEDSPYALVSADLNLSKTANLNFIQNLNLHQDFVSVLDMETGKKVFAVHESSLVLRYEAGLDLMGIPIPANAKSKRLLARVSSIYDNIRINDPNGRIPPAGGMVQNIPSFDSDSSAAFWEQNRPGQLSDHEKAIYGMANDIRKDKKQQIFDRTLSTIADGTFTVARKFRFGPVGAMVSTNRIEGTRYRLGFRTTEQLFRKVSVFGHAAYGTRDQAWKGSLGLRHLSSIQPYLKTEILGSRDIQALSDWNDDLDSDNLMNSFLRKKVPFFRTNISKLSLTQDRQIAGNFFIHAGLSVFNIDPAFRYYFQNPFYENDISTPGIIRNIHTVYSSEATLGLRFAWQETSKIVFFQREPIFSKYPTVSFTFTQGLKTKISGFDYNKYELTVAHKTRISPKTRYLWVLDAGQVFGTLPSLLLHIPNGNDAFVMSSNAFNTMTPYEFTADRYISYRSRLSLGGTIFDLIPIIQKLGWRERFTFNAFWGDLTPANRAFNKAINPVTADKDPFIEAGVGIENILHLFSLDLVRRFNYLDSPGAVGNRIGVYFGLKTFF